MNNAVTALPTSTLDDDLQTYAWHRFLTDLAPSGVLQDSAALPDAASPRPMSATDRKTLQQWIASDFANGSIGCGFGDLLELPLCLRNPGSAAIVWNHWYGSQRQVTRVMELLLKVRSPETAAFARNAQRSSPAVVLSMLLGNPRLGERLLRQLPPADREKADPARRLAGQLRSLLGEAHGELASQCRDGTAVELAGRIETHWPCMVWLHDQGAYLPHLVEPLLQLGLLRERLQAGAWSGADRSRAILAASLLLHALPPRLAALLAIHASPFRECGAQPWRFFGLNGDTFDPARPVWEQMDAQVARDTLAYLLCADAGNWSEAPGTALDQVRQLEARLVQHGSLPRTLASLYQRFCAEDAGPRYAQLREAFVRYSAALEIKMEAGALPAQLIGRPLQFERIADHAALQQRLRALVEQEAECIDIPGLLAASQQRLDRLQGMHAQIVTLGQTPSVSGLLKIAELAEAARQEILANRDWFTRSLAETRPYVALWEGFYAGIEKLQRQTTPTSKSEKREQKAAESALGTPLTANGNENEVILQLRQQLHDARHATAQLREELKDARGEQHRLQRMADAVGALPPRVAAPAVDTTLLRRVASARDSLSPSEVLAYFSQLAGSRLMVLDSAWDSAAEYPGQFAATERLFDLLDKLLFPYLDAINSGTPDTQARGIFGSKAYCAKESETSLSDARLRAQREFTWRGEKRLFVRHLRVSNQTGLEGMRVYFDIIDGQVVIAYVGPHLPVSTSN